MSGAGRILLLSVALLVVIGSAVYGLLLLRRVLFGEDEDRREHPLTLHEIRAMHARGDIDAMEFERLRSVALAEWRRPKIGERTENHDVGGTRE